MDILTKQMKDLPIEMSREIFSYLIPDPDKVEFHKEWPSSFCHNSYSDKYDVAFVRNITDMDTSYLSRIANKIYYLSRIANKNGKHQYYITREFVDRKSNVICCGYRSKYIGNDLVRALFVIMLI